VKLVVKWIIRTERSRQLHQPVQHQNRSEIIANTFSKTFSQLSPLSVGHVMNKWLKAHRISRPYSIRHLPVGARIFRTVNLTEYNWFTVFIWADYMIIMSLIWWKCIHSSFWCY
jgi:hypothetical protein